MVLAEALATANKRVITKLYMYIGKKERQRPTFNYLELNQINYFAPVHMIPGHLIALGQLTDPGLNFASVHGLTPVTVHMSFPLPRGNFERRITGCTTSGSPPCRRNFSPREQNAKLARGKSSLPHAHY